MAEGGEVAFGDASAEGFKGFSEPLAFWTAAEVRGREAAEDHVRGDEIDEDQATLLQAFEVALAVGGLESELGTIEVAVGEMITTQVVEESDALRSREPCERRRLLVDVAKDLLCAAKLSAVEEEFQAEVCGQVDSDSSSFGVPAAIESGRITAPLAETLFEGFSDHVGRALDQRDSLSTFLGSGSRFASGQVRDKIGSLVKTDCKSGQSTRQRNDSGKHN